jgi:HEAT repeat protein
VLLAREQRAFPSMAASLFTPGKGETTPRPLAAEALDQALASKEPGRAYTAAFLIGRCQIQDTAVEKALTRRLEETLDGTPEPDVAIEAAMSLALRGNVERGRQTLRALLNSPHPLGDQYKAAFYLAQMGDPSGYGALVKTLHSEIPHYRLMAMRHAIAFAPYGDQKVNDIVVDVRKLLVERLADPDELVRSEVPFYLEELQIPDLRTLLQPVEQHDPSPSVRTAARIVLDRNR